MEMRALLLCVHCLRLCFDPNSTMQYRNSVSQTPDYPRVECDHLKQ